MNPASPLPGGGGGHSNPANVAVPPADRPLPRRLGRKSGRTRFSQEAHMKTTLNIDDSVMQRLREAAARRGTTMSALVEAGLVLRHD